MAKLLVLPALVLTALAQAGCAGEDEAIVFVDPSIESPQLAVSGSALGVSLSGGFRLRLVLGPRASGPSQVSLGSFAITDAEQKTPVVASLAVASSVPLPITVQPGSDVGADLIFDTGADTLPAEIEDALCAPAGVRIAGTVQDILQDGATPVASEPFQPTGCM